MTIYVVVTQLESGRPFMAQFADREAAVAWQQANGGEIWTKEVGKPWQKDEDTQSSDD